MISYDILELYWWLGGTRYTGPAYKCNRVCNSIHKLRIEAAYGI